MEGFVSTSNTEFSLRRARLNRLSPEDREIRERLIRATRELEGALRIASSIRGARASRTLRELNALLRACEDVGVINPLAEEKSPPSYREKLAEAGQKRREAQKKERRKARKAKVQA